MVGIVERCYEEVFVVDYPVKLYLWFDVVEWLALAFFPWPEPRWLAASALV